MEEERQFVTLAQGSALANLSEVSLRRAVKRGELQFYRASNYRLHLDRAELTAWIEKRKQLVRV